MIDYVADIQPHEGEMSDAEIANHLSSRTAAPISCADARITLQGDLAVIEDPATGTRSGSLIDHYASLQQGEEKSLLSWAIFHIFGKGYQISTHEHPRSTQFGAVVSGMSGDLATTIQKVISGAGGQPDNGTSVADVADAREAHKVAEAENSRQESLNALRAEIENTWINPAVADGSSTAADVRAAIKAGI